MLTIENRFVNERYLSDMTAVAEPGGGRSGLTVRLAGLSTL
jgi:hypothetical protein